jgi:tyrosine-protein kinase Etk/Wzc
MQKKIPIINDTFDIVTFKRILVSSFWVGILILLLVIGAAMLKIRYTSPLYEAKSIIQIAEDNKTSQVFQLDNLYDDNKKLSKTVALIRSKEFLKRTFNQLPLDIRYYVQGAFLNDESYKSSSYHVDYKITNSRFYGIPISVYFPDKENVIYQFEMGADEREVEGETGKWVDLGGMQVKTTFTNYSAIQRMYESEKQNSYFFIAYNEDQIYETHSQLLAIRLLSSSSNSIEISYRSNNTQQAADVVNNIAREFQVFEVEKKRESVANILAFIERQLTNIYTALDTTENRLQEFKKEHNIVSNSSEKTVFPFFTTKIDGFDEQITMLEFELITLKNVEEQLASQDQVNIYEMVASLAGTNSERVLVSILNNLQQYINERNKLLNEVTEDNMRVKIIDRQIANQKSLILDFITNNILRIEERITEYKKRMQEYEDKLFADDTFDKLEFARMQRLHDINEGFYNQLIQKKAEYMISQAGYVT